MSNINKIKVSGTTYSIQDENACKVVELTQAQYDELPTTAKTSNSLFVITDATAGDLSNYYTKSETSGATEISTALASKQTTLTAGTGISIVDNVISATGGGGGVTIDPSLDSGSTNPVANSAITTAINSKMDEVNFASFYGDKYSAGLKGYYYDSQTETQTEKFNWGMVWQSDGSIGLDSLGNLAVFNKIDTSAITTSVTSSSTDAQVPSAKSVYDQLGGLKLVKLSQSEYDALATKDSSTLYIING